MTAADRDLAERQLADGITVAREFTGCITCRGTGRVRVPDPTASNWFPKPPMWGWCPTCDGTGKGQP